MPFAKTCAYEPCSASFISHHSRTKFCSRSCTGKSRGVRTDPAIRAYFFANIRRTDAPDDCWEWIGQRNEHGYGMASIRGEKHLRAHRLSHELFKAPLKRHEYVLHDTRCWTRACVNPDHLRIGTQRENMADAKFLGRVRHGENHYFARLTKTQVRHIRALYKEGWLLQPIATKYGVSPGAIDQIIKGRTWKHVPDEEPMEMHDGRRKLTQADTDEVIRLHHSGEMSAIDIAKRYRLSDMYVRTLSRRAKHIKENPKPSSKPPLAPVARQGRLTEDEVRTIRSLAAEGYSMRAISDAYGITHHQVGNILSRKAWATID